MLKSSIWLISGATTPGHNGPGSNGNEGWTINPTLIAIVYKSYLIYTICKHIL